MAAASRAGAASFLRAPADTGSGIESADRARRLLVISPDATAGALLRRLHEREAWEVHVAADRAAGLRTLFDVRPDVILVDADSTHADGLKTLERIRAFTDAPVMMLGVNARAAETVSALRAGADDHISKPFGLNEILARTSALARRGGAPRSARPT